MEPLARIQELVTQNPVVIFMKGTPAMPRCGFSQRAAKALELCEVEFAYVDVLSDQEVYENLPSFADWPTFPQIYVNGELMGGCDITVEMYNKGELKPMLQAAVGNSK